MENEEQLSVGLHVIHPGFLFVEGLRFPEDQPLVRFEPCRCGCGLLGGLTFASDLDDSVPCYQASHYNEGCLVSTDLGLPVGQYAGVMDLSQGALFVFRHH